MSSFYGGYVHTVDAKGRFSIPAQIRNGLSEFARNTFVVLPGPDGCLAAYPLDEWEDREKFMRSFPEADVSRYYMRVALRRARHCRMDGHKRVLIQPELLATVSIKDSVLKNVGNRLTKGHSNLGTLMQTQAVDAVIMWNGVAHNFRKHLEVVPTPYEYETTIRVHVIGLGYSSNPELVKQFVSFAKQQGEGIFASYGYVK